VKKTPAVPKPKTDQLKPLWERYKSKLQLALSQLKDSAGDSTDS